MAHFRATIIGSAKHTTTRTGSKKSDMVSHTCGETIGARVELQHVDGHDICRVFRTGGRLGGPIAPISEFHAEATT